MSKWSSAFRDSRWQKKRLEVMDDDKWTCQSCGASGKGVTLNVHHAYYEAGKAPWEYDSDTLYTLCEDCHEKFHRGIKSLSAIMLSCASMGSLPIENAMDLFIGYLHGLSGPAWGEGAYYQKGYALSHIDVSEEAISSIIKNNTIGKAGEK